MARRRLRLLTRAASHIRLSFSEDVVLCVLHDLFVSLTIIERTTRRTVGKTNYIQKLHCFRVKYVTHCCSRHFSVLEIICFVLSAPSADPPE